MPELLIRENHDNETTQFHSFTIPHRTANTRVVGVILDENLDRLFEARFRQSDSLTTELELSNKSSVVPAGSEDCPAKLKAHLDIRVCDIENDQQEFVRIPVTWLDPRADGMLDSAAGEG
jgi:hypothetical protein